MGIRFCAFCSITFVSREIVINSIKYNNFGIAFSYLPAWALDFNL
jgi:hypothetical protein